MNARETDGILDTIERWTGERPTTCPWRAFFDPFVARVLEQYRAFDKGGLAWSAPDPSHRLVKGLLYYARVHDACAAKRLELEREQMSRG